jgi:hypothetical protein
MQASQQQLAGLIPYPITESFRPRVVQVLLVEAQALTVELRRKLVAV